MDFKCPVFGSLIVLMIQVLNWYKTKNFNFFRFKNRNFLAKLLHNPVLRVPLQYKLSMLKYYAILTDI